MYNLILFTVFPLCLAFAAWSDLFTMTIPNKVPLILLASFALLAPFSGLGMTDLAFHLAAGLAVFAGCFLLFALNTMGGGDAKLLTVAAVWFGFNHALFDFLTYVALAGGVVTLLVMAIRSQSSLLAVTGITLPHSLTTEKKIPYGIAIAIAAFIAYPQSPLMMDAIQRMG